MVERMVPRWSGMVRISGDWVATIIELEARGCQRAAVSLEGLTEA
jgi:hypothetical protein